MNRILFALVILAYSAPAFAQLPHIRLDRIQPLGGKAGGDVELEIQGKDLDDLQGLRFDHPGLKAELIKDKKFKVTIAPDVAPGTYEVRAIGRFGLSGVRLFHVQNSLAEVKEVEPNDAEKAQPVAVNSVINGTSDGNGDDFFKVPLKKDQRIVVDCFGIRLDSTIRAVLSILGPDGSPKQQSRPYFLRTDPLLDFVAPADGDYLIRLHDMTFSGGLPYRLVITDQPYVENVFPSAVRPGEKSTLTVWGRNLPGGKSAGAPSTHDAPLEENTFTFDAPVSPTGLSKIFHLSSPSLNARGLQIFAGKGVVNPTTLAWADAPLVLDKEPNDARDTAQKIELPAVLAGRFEKRGDADWYTFAAKAGQAFTVDLLCERLDFPGDPFVVIFDAKGNEVLTVDDHGINTNALGQFNRDGVGLFKAPRDETYHLLVQDRYGNGGPRFQYVLRLVKSEPDFFPVVYHETNPDPSCPLLWKGGSAFYEICLNRRDFNGPVTLEIDGLPPGVTCPPTHVSPQTQNGTLVVTASADAAPWTGMVKIKATGMADGKKIEREVQPTQRRWAIANINTCVMLRETGLAVRPDVAPYAIVPPKDAITVEAGKPLEAKVTIQRAGDFTGKVQLTGLNLPPGFSVPTTDIADKEGMLKINVAANVPPGDYSFFVRGDAQVPYSKDAKATARPNVRVALPSPAFQILVTPASKK